MNIAYQAYQNLKEMGVSDSFIEGFLILVDDKYPDESAVRFLLSCEELGKDPFDQAKHLVHLRKQMRGRN